MQQHKAWNQEDCITKPNGNIGNGKKLNYKII